MNFTFQVTLAQADFIEALQRNNIPATKENIRLIFQELDTVEIQETIRHDAFETLLNHIEDNKIVFTSDDVYRKRAKLITLNEFTEIAEERTKGSFSFTATIEFLSEMQFDSITEPPFFETAETICYLIKVIAKRYFNSINKYVDEECNVSFVKPSQMLGKNFEKNDDPFNMINNVYFPKSGKWYAVMTNIKGHDLSSEGTFQEFVNHVICQLRVPDGNFKK
ncbi:hypothetical protein P5495_021990 [Bacillus velezensis]|uniref:hypothetical protein n=1 Tax=Bacillus amyloliquefaciens group TaxID=1938374 RepID=UPI001CD80EC4|nr:hypothetical protein [Bacillus amyloliquefaciens]MDH3075830.1 hypothetical protein [Bacillus velezensis]MDH3104096.1 hypothetical protein [Bacillus velezensis]MDH3139000.1 hypothetical protein [Bacillus velezensis]